MRSPLPGPAAKADREEGRTPLRRDRLLTRLNETQLDLAAADPHLDQIMTLVLERVFELTEADGASFTMVEGGDNVVTAEAGSSRGLLGVRVPVEQTAAGHAIATGRAYLIPRLSEDPRPARVMLERLADGSMICVPIFLAGKAVGSLNAVRRRDLVPLDEVDLQTLELLGGMTSSALARTSEREALWKFEALFRDSPLGIAMLGPDGTVLEMNQAFAAILDRPLGFRFNLGEDLARVHPEDRAQATQQLGALLRGDVESSSLEFRVVPDDGAVKWLDGRASVVRDDHGEPGFVLVMTQDVTERKLTEEALFRKTTQLSGVIEAEREVTARGGDVAAASAIAAGYACDLTGAEGALVELFQDERLVVRAAVGSLTLPLDTALDSPEAQELLAGLPAQLRVPVQQGDSTLGWLRVAAADREWTEEDEQALELLAVVLAAAVSRVAAVEARAMFEAVYYRDSPVGIALLDLDSRIIELNDALVHESGFTREQLLSMAPEEYLHPDDVERLQAPEPALIGGQSDVIRAEHRLRPVDGVVRWKDSMISFVRGEDGEPRFAMLVSLDITERKLAEMALREKAERLSAIVETQAEIGAAGSDVDGVMKLVCERAAELTKADGATFALIAGDELEVKIGVGSGESMSGRRIPMAESGFLAAIDSGRALLIGNVAADPRSTQAMVEEFGERSALYVPVFRGGKVVGCLGASSTSEQRLDDEDRQTLELLGGMLSSALSRSAELAAERERVETLKRFETVYRDSPIGIGMLNLRGEGPRWLGMNERMEEIRGYTAAELSALDPTDYIHPDDLPALAGQFTALQSGSSEFERIELRQFRKDGALVWTESAVSLVRDEDGAPLFAIVMVQDVTQSKLAEETMRRNSERLARIVETQADVAAAGSDLGAALRIVAERAHTLTRAEGAVVGLVEGGEVVILAATGLAAPHEGLRRPLHESVTGLAIEAGEAVLIDDVRSNRRLDRSLVRATGERSHVCAPLVRGEQVVGSLSIMSASEEQPLNEEDRQTVELLTVVLSSAISRTAEVDALTKFELIYRGSPVGIGLVGLDGRFTELNDVLCQILGHDREALVGQQLAQQVHPDDLDDVRSLWNELLAGAFDSYRVEHRVFAGSEVHWVNGAVSLVRDGDGAPRFAIVMCQDVTQRKHAELALRDSNERLARIVATQGEVAALGADLESVTRLIVDRVVELSRAEGASVSLIEGVELVTRASTGIAADLAGYRRPLARTISATAIESGRGILIDHVEDDPRLYRPLVAKTGERSHICVPLYHGERFIGSLSAQSASEHERLDEQDLNTLELLGVLLSSGISRSAESQALSRFEAIYQDAPIGIGLLTLDGVLVDANAAMVGITGYELSGRPVSDYTHPDDVDELVANFRRLIRGDVTSYRFEARHFRKDGGLAWVDSAVTLLRDPDGTPTFALTMAQDVTDRRAAEEQLRQSQKIDAIGQLSAGIAHDFNNLLMGVLGYAGLARAELEPGSRVADYLDKIETTGHRAASLTKQLLAFGRRQTLQPRLVDLNDLVGETLSMLDRLLGEHIEIIPRLDPTLPQLRADPTQLQQVLFNLALNARDAMPGGGTLTIETTSVELSAPEVGGSLELPPGRYVVFSVADTGFGMTEEVKARIFEPFFTTKGVGEGTGLGLPSVYGIVKQSRGEIEVVSEPHGGTVFRIYLPAADGRPFRAGDGRPALARVLLLEEADVVSELVTTLLGQEGYDVVVARNPDHAMQLAREHASFDVLLTDLVLARTSGVHIAARIQEHQPSIRVLYMSAYEPDERLPEESLIPKPFSNEALLEKLAQLLSPA